MCSFGSSNNSAPTTQYSTQTTVAAPQAQAMYNSAWANAQTTAQRPFQPYSYDPNAFAAPMNSTQLTAVNNLYQQQNAGQPFYQAAPAMAYSAGNTNAAGLAGAYMSPYLDSVAASTMGWLNQQQAQQQNQLAGQIAKNGQWGNDRSGIERAILAGQQNMATNSAMSNLYNQGYNTALGAAQTDLTRQLQAAQNLAGQGQTATGSLLQAGTLGQQTQQKGLEGLYNQYMMQQQYPFQVSQFLASTAAGLGPGYGSTTSGMQNSQQPLSYFGNPLSDPRLKTGAGGEEPEVIGQTNDGQDIYRYRLMDPDTGRMGPPQIGLMADEVAQRRPDAIGDYKGFRTVDYKKATDDAARMGGGVMGRGDYAEGGLVSIVPQDFKMPTAHLDSPTLHYMTPPERKESSLGQMAKETLGLIDSGKKLYDEGSSLYGSLESSNLAPKMGVKVLPTSFSGRATGGLVNDEDRDPEMRQGPDTSAPMPTAHLDAPSLSYARDEKQKSGGLGDAINDAAGIAGSLKTLWDIGSKAAPFIMSLSDPRLKTGVRPARKGGGGLSATDLFDYFVNEKGADPREAAVLTSGAGVESNFNPEAVHDKGTGYGLWGHRLDRYDAMKRFTGEDRPGWHGQADFALDEFRRRPEHKMAMSSNDPEALTRAQMFYERPAGFSTAHPEAGRYYDRRLALTQQLLGGDRDKGLGAGVMALAAPEGRPRNGGLDAIDAATRGRGVVPPAASPVTAAASEDMAPAQGISGMIRGKPASGLGERALDFATSERFLVPLLTGLGTMASSGSRYLAPAVLQGLGAGAGAYMQLPKIQAETDLAKAEAENKRALTPKFAAEAGQVLANTGLVKAQTAKQQAEMINDAIVEKGGRLFVRVVKPDGSYDLVNYGEWNAMDPSERPPLAPRDSGASPSLASPSGTASNTPAASQPASTEPPVAPSAPTSLNFDLSPEQASAAAKAAASKSGWSTTNQATVPDFFAPQAQVAKGAQDQKQIMIPLASSLAQLPKGKSLLTSGRAQEFFSPVAATINNLLAGAGFSTRIANPQDVANQEEVKKLVNQLQREASTSAQQHTLGALRDMAEGIPGIFTSPEGQGKLVAQILTNTQRQIDKNEFFTKWAKAAGGKRGAYGEWARLTSPEANAAFDNDKGTNARYTRDREYLEKLFNQKVLDHEIRDEAGNPKTITLMELLGSRPQDADEELLAHVRKNYPGVLRYFGLK